MQNAANPNWYRLGTDITYGDIYTKTSSVFPILGKNDPSGKITTFGGEAVKDSLSGLVLEELVKQIIAKNP